AKNLAARAAVHRNRSDAGVVHVSRAIDAVVDAYLSRRIRRNDGARGMAQLHGSGTTEARGYGKASGRGTFDDRAAITRRTPRQSIHQRCSEQPAAAGRRGW